MSTSISLPVFDRDVLDNSILEAHGRCPRLAFFNYRLNRASTKKSYPILFGVAYHKYREILENLYLDVVVEQGQELDDIASKIHKVAVHEALDGWEDPPLEHKKSYLDEGRLLKTLEGAFERWKREKEQGKFKVLSTETAFDLELPSGRRFGGRVDQILEWNNKLWVRDFKTTSRMGSSYSLKFDPNHQFTGYTWAAQQLSGREVEGVLVEVVYNTKRQGPEYHRFISSRSPFHIKTWLEWIEEEYDRWEAHVKDESWPMRTSSCDDYGGCFFREACRQGSWRMIEGWLENETVFSAWDFQNPDEEEGFTAD